LILSYEWVRVNAPGSSKIELYRNAANWVHSLFID
jgi:hypothetical protein